MKLIEAGCDEAGRGCLAGPVFAAAVIFPKGYKNKYIDDSKKVNPKQRLKLREAIESDALSWSVASVSSGEIDKINILNASFLAMHKAISQLTTKPELLLIDGNRFNPFPGIPHQCIVKGDAKFISIAAASILAKTYRDDYMIRLHREFPSYGWDRNKGYPSRLHRETIIKYGISPYHRKSFNLTGQLKISF